MPLVKEIVNFAIETLVFQNKLLNGALKYKTSLISVIIFAILSRRSDMPKTTKIKFNSPFLGSPGLELSQNAFAQNI